MASQSEKHTVMGEHEYDGVVYDATIPKLVLDRVKYEFKLRDDDVIIATYPKSGTTWIREIVWLIMNNANVSEALSILQNIRIPCLEFEGPTGPLNIDILEEAESPRIIQTHLPFRFFSKQLRTKKTKVILGARNVKDMLVSFYHFYQMNVPMGNFTGSFDEFFKLFEDKRLAFGDWFDFNLEYWNNRHDINFFLLKYEDLHLDFCGTVKKLSNFLGKEMSEAQHHAIAEHVAFEAMKINDKVNKSTYTAMKVEISPFIRKGIVGDWKNYLTKEQSKYIDKLYKENIEGTGLEFDFKIV